MHACFCFYVVKTKEAQDCPPKGDHGNPKGYNRGLSPCMHGAEMLTKEATGVFLRF